MSLIITCGGDVTQDGERVSPVCCCGDQRPVMLEVVFEKVAGILVVVDDKDVHPSQLALLDSAHWARPNAMPSKYEFPRGCRHTGISFTSPR